MNLEELRNDYNNGKQFEFLFFWGSKGPADKITNAVFSQWYKCNFQEDDIVYNCAEQYMMAQKAKLFNDEEIFNKIMSSNDPKEMKALGRKVKNFNAEIWDKNCVDIVTRGNVLKFSQNEKLKQYLLDTKDKILVEASPYDAIWGIKMSRDNPDVLDPNKWQGTNFLGFALVEVRETLKKQNVM